MGRRHGRNRTGERVLSGVGPRGWWYRSILRAPVTRNGTQGHVGSGSPPGETGRRRPKANEPPEVQSGHRSDRREGCGKRSRDLGRPVGLTPKGARRINPTNQDGTPPTKSGKGRYGQKKKTSHGGKEYPIHRSFPDPNWEKRFLGSAREATTAYHPAPHLRCIASRLHAGTGIPNWQRHHTGRAGGIREEKSWAGALGERVARAEEGGVGELREVGDW